MGWMPKCTGLVIDRSQSVFSQGDQGHPNSLWSGETFMGVMDVTVTSSSELEGLNLPRTSHDLSIAWISLCAKNNLFSTIHSLYYDSWSLFDSGIMLHFLHFLQTLDTLSLTQKSTLFNSTSSSLAFLHSDLHTSESISCQTCNFWTPTGNHWHLLSLCGPSCMVYSRIPL